MTDPAAPHKQRIAQAVEITDRCGRHTFRAAQSHRGPLGAAAHRAGEVKRGRIGVAIQDLTPDLADAMKTSHTTGAVIAKVETGSPAERAGLRNGDLVVALNGTVVNSGTQLRNLIGLARIGDEVTLTIDRRGSEYSIAVRIDPASSTAAARQRVRQR